MNSPRCWWWWCGTRASVGKWAQKCGSSFSLVCVQVCASLSLSPCVWDRPDLSFPMSAQLPPLFFPSILFIPHFLSLPYFSFLSCCTHTQVSRRRERENPVGGADGTRNSSLVAFLLHRWRSHLRMGAPGNIKWVLLFGLNRNERRSKQQFRESLFGSSKWGLLFFLVVKD